MLRNFFKVALRNIIRQKSYVFINIAGLAIGIASSIVIILFVVNELSYDKFNAKHKQIYRVYLDGKIGESEIKGAWTASPTAKALKNEIPEVIEAVRMDNWDEAILKIEDRSYVEQHFMLADSAFFEIFSIPLIQGDPKTALAAPHNLVLTRSAAKKYFGNEDPIGKHIYVNSDTTFYSVTGIMEDVPDNAHFEFNVLGSFATHHRANDGQWLSNSFNTYLLLRDDASYSDVETKIKPILEKYIGPQLQQAIGVSVEEWLSAGNRYGLYLQPLDDIHLNPEIQHSLKPSNDIKYVYIFSVVALLIIVVAIINYMNLATARSIKRAKEVGLRKVTGSSKGQLIGLFLFESVILSFLSLILALVLVHLTLPLVNQITRLNLSFDLFSNWIILPGLLFLTILIGIIAGSYPSFVLSSFKPVSVISGLYKGSRKSLLRSVLVVFQFCISVIIILGTIIIYRQINYMLNKDLGFDKEQLMVIKRAGALGNYNKIKIFQEEIGKYPGVLASTNSTAVPGHPNNNNGFMIDGRSASDQTVLMNVNWVDYDFLDTYGMKMKEGRFLSKEFPSDSISVIINESAVRKFGFASPLSERFVQPAETPEERIKLNIIGVVENFHYQSLHEDIYPHVFIRKPESWNWGGYVTVRLAPGDIKTTIRNIEKTWKDFAPSDPIQYVFMDEDFENMYREEIRTSNISLGFAVLSILIACLGLFGLTSYASEQRTKEIGIRKVLGSAVSGVIVLLTREIFLLVSIATLLAWPVTYLIMKNWLQNFHYRISLSVWEFLLSFVLAIMIAMLTVIYRAYIAARSNPAVALKYE
ncbi:MAG: ABC transporter permease [Bacteroidales bacterium]|nr:ABC transporter permease [Bacteroidales bacterium]